MIRSNTYLTHCKRCGYIFYPNDKWIKQHGKICRTCLRKKMEFKELSFENILKEPTNIHCYCNKCGEKIVLPEEVWLKRGAICNRCYHQIREED